MLSSLRFFTLCVRSAVRSTPSISRFSAVHVASFTTYSGGQPSEGQGGFYGAMKSRSEHPVFQPGARVEEQDLQRLNQLMQTWNERTKDDEQDAAAWKDFLTAHAPSLKELLERLVVKGAPVWGLSVQQRQFVARCHHESLTNTTK